VDALAALYATTRAPATPPTRAPRGRRRARALLGGVPEVVRRHPLAFHTILEGEDKAMLEWTSDCETAAGVKTSYDGVSVFETRGGRITRFTAYFDPADLDPTRTEGKHQGARAAADAGAYGSTHGGVESGAQSAAETA
jgi:ketosteroid isomerase-like protein